MDNTLLISILAGTALVVALGGYALHLWRQVWKRREQLESHKKEVSDKLAEDLKVLCSSLLDEQMPWVEGCIRLKVILEHYNFELSHDAEYAVFQEVFVATEHIPTHDAWKALDRAEKRKHEKTFATLEEQFHARSFTAARQLLQRLGGPLKASMAAPTGTWSPAMDASPAEGKPTLH